jgi:Xaa-Pro aminopeptidase
MYTRYFPISEYERRWASLHEIMKKNGTDVTILWSRSAGNYDRCGDSLYLTNYFSTESGCDVDGGIRQGSGYSAVIIEIGKKPMLICDEPPQPHLIATDHFEWAYNVIGKAGEYLARFADKNVCLSGSDILPMKYAKIMYDACPNLTINDKLLAQIRMRKSNLELDAMRHGGEIVTSALDLLFKALFEGKSEAEAAAIGAAEVIRHGGAYHYIPVNHGDIDNFTDNPLTGYTTDTPNKGDLMRAWIYGPIYEGYWLDPGRTTVLGTPAPAQKHLVESCANIVNTLIEHVKPGVTALELAKMGKDMTKAFGGVEDQAALKWPLYGHGIGLFWDEPAISAEYSDGDQVFEAGMAIGIESFLSSEDGGSAGFEQNLIITDTGTELLTKTPMIWWD